MARVSSCSERGSTAPRSSSTWCTRLGQANFGDVDRHAAANVAGEAARAGARQIVFLGGLGDDDPSLSAHLRSRAETARVLADGDVPVTALRAAVVVGRGSAAFDTIVALVERSERRSTRRPPTC